MPHYELQSAFVAAPPPGRAVASPNAPLERRSLSVPPHLEGSTVAWCLTADGGSNEVHLLPDACADLKIDLETGASWVTGARAEPQRHTLAPRARTRLLGFRFAPGHAAAVLGVDATEITRLTLEDLFGARARSAIDRAREAPRAEGAIAAFEALLRPVRAPDARVQRIVARIFASRGAVAIDDLADAAGVSARQLVRMFERTVGLSPKRVARIARLQSILREARSGTGWARLAIEHGYVDQAHLVHDVASLTGLSPTKIASEIYKSR